MDFSRYPHDFLGLVINRLYTNVIKDPRLSKFYPIDRGLARTKLESSVRIAVERGTSRYLRLRMHRIHEDMGVTDRDFEQYLRYFADAMVAEGAVASDVSETLSVLNDFKSDVVIPKKVEPEPVE